MSARQGSYLLSSDRGAIRIEYAKSKMVADAALAIAQLERSMCFSPLIFAHTEYVFSLSNALHHHPPTPHLISV